MAQLVARYVRDVEAARSSRVTPTSFYPTKKAAESQSLLLFCVRQSVIWDDEFKAIAAIGAFYHQNRLDAVARGVARLGLDVDM